MESDSKNKQKKKRDFNWGRQLAIAQSFWSEEFPDKDDYAFSMWAMWESRIHKGHEAEEKRTEDMIKRMEMRSTPKQLEAMPDDLFADEFYFTSQLSNNMYAALFVSLWSCIEGYLKDLLSVCRGAKQIKRKIPYHFGEMKKSFSNEMNIEVEQLSKYSTVNAIQILNNSFKHSEGYYLPQEDKPHTGRLIGVRLWILGLTFLFLSCKIQECQENPELNMAGLSITS